MNRELGKLPHDLRIAIDRARSDAVATFGTITRGVQVYGTPTLLVVEQEGPGDDPDRPAEHLHDRPGDPGIQEALAVHSLE